MHFIAALALLACSGEAPAPETAPPPVPAEPAPAPKVRSEGPLPSIVVTQAWFKDNKPQPAKMVVYSLDGDTWYDETILDKDSNVFHKGMAWRDGILTIGAMKAMAKHWKKVDGTWKDTTIWEQSWGGKFDRLRDVELGDLDGDGKDEMALATHDQGVVAVGDEGDDGAWTFQEFDKTPDIFVHEVEIGDVDGDGKKEFYVTPSERNKSSGASQPGGVARYDFRDGTYKKTQVVWWDESHAKEILVTDIDGDGTDELYVVKEGHVVVENGKKTLKDPVTLVKMAPEGKPNGPWTETVVATLEGEHQTRFVVPGDVDGDGKTEIVLAGMDTGLYVLQPGDDGTFTAELVDKNSGGFEHATHVADLDKDGTLEIYVASDKQRQLRRYTWGDGKWNREKIADFPKNHITWNLQDGVF